MRILGIETSCDETAASVVQGDLDKFQVLSNVISSQIEIHKKYGGVIPEVAARQHVLNILPVVNESLEKAGIKKDKASKDLDAIAVANGPGLVTSLIVGVETAKSLALAWDLPLVGINHIEGHIYSNFLEHAGEIEFPAVILTVSGGHTMLVLMRDHFSYEVLGETRDDAAGEAFDKAAQLLDIGYPGGPIVSQKAAEFKEQGGSSDIEFPRPMLRNKDLDFSFSGLKTSLLYKIQKDPDWKERVSEYCYGFQRAIVEVLSQKTVRAAQEKGAKTVLLSGGVSANTELKKQLQKDVSEKMPRAKFFSPSPEYTTDNAAMIAAAGYYRALHQKTSSWEEVRVSCNAELK